MFSVVANLRLIWKAIRFSHPGEEGGKRGEGNPLRRAEFLSFFVSPFRGQPERGRKKKRKRKKGEAVAIAVLLRRASAMREGGEKEREGRERGRPLGCLLLVFFPAPAKVGKGRERGGGSVLYLFRRHFPCDRGEEEEKGAGLQMLDA